MQTYLHDHILPTYHIPASSIRSAAFTDNVPSLFVFIVPPFYPAARSPILLSPCPQFRLDSKVQRACSFQLTHLVKLPKAEPNAKGRTNFDQYLTVFAPAGAPTAGGDDGHGDGGEKIRWEELEWCRA